MFNANNLWLIWLIVAAVMLAIEMATAMLVTVWFVAGGLAALIAALLGADLTVQLIIFVAVSVVCLLIGWRLRDRLMMQRHKTPTNADRLIGQTGILEEGCNPLTDRGRVKVLGQDWRAVSADGTEIPAGTQVVIQAISGAKLTVRPADSPTPAAGHMPPTA